MYWNIARSTVPAVTATAKVNLFVEVFGIPDKHQNSRNIRD
jgi:hypothetical protein